MSAATFRSQKSQLQNGRSKLKAKSKRRSHLVTKNCLRWNRGRLLRPSNVQATTAFSSSLKSKESNGDLARSVMLPGPELLSRPCSRGPKQNRLRLRSSSKARTKARSRISIDRQAGFVLL